MNFKQNDLILKTIKELYVYQTYEEVLKINLIFFKF